MRNAPGLQVGIQHLATVQEMSCRMRSYAIAQLQHAAQKQDFSRYNRHTNSTSSMIRARICIRVLLACTSFNSKQHHAIAYRNSINGRHGTPGWSCPRSKTEIHPRTNVSCSSYLLSPDNVCVQGCTMTPCNGVSWHASGRGQSVRMLHSRTRYHFESNRTRRSAS